MRRRTIAASSGSAFRASRRAVRPTSGSACRSTCPAAAPGRTATPFEKVYVVLDGEMTVIVDGKETVLGKYDSCTIPPSEVREIVNRQQPRLHDAGRVIPYPPGAKP